LKGNKWAAAISASENTIFKHCAKMAGVSENSSINSHLPHSCVWHISGLADPETNQDGFLLMQVLMLKCH